MSVRKLAGLVMFMYLIYLYTMEDNLIDYAGYDAIDATLTIDKVVAIATTQAVIYRKLSLLPVHEKILQSSSQL